MTNGFYQLLQSWTEKKVFLVMTRDGLGRHNFSSNDHKLFKGSFRPFNRGPTSQFLTSEILFSFYDRFVWGHCLLSQLKTNCFSVFIQHLLELNLS